MELEEFDKLDKELKARDFHSEFKGFSKIAFKASFIGNLFSIGFAYFFVYDLINSIVLEPTTFTTIMVVVVTMIILVGSEVIKRFIFDKFTKSFIVDNYTFKNAETKVLSMVSVLLITLSFYLSLNGAKEFANKTDDITENMTDNIEHYQDSLKSVFEKKTARYDSIVNSLVNQNNTYDNEITLLNNKIMAVEGNSWRETNERKVYTEQIESRSKDKDRNIAQIEKYDSKIKELKKDYDIEIEQYVNKQEQNTENFIAETSSTPARFLIFSTIIEFIILFGIWFINYFKLRSYSEQKEKQKKDPKYKQFLLWKEILDVFYTGDARIGHYTPFKSELVKLLKINSVNIQNKELDDAYKVMTQLGILLNKGKRKELLVEYEDAIKIIKSHFKIS